MKKILIGAFALAFVLGGCSNKADLSNEDNKTFYAVGSMFGSRLLPLAPSDAELNALAQGLKDAASKKDLAVDVNVYQAKVQELFKARMGQNNDKMKKEGTDYLAKFLKESGVLQTKSGLAYKILAPGKGAKPKETDIVEVHYHGTLVDGTVFDSPVERGKKVSFPLNRVIKGWTEGLQLISVGGKIKLVIPADLAYGDTGAPPKIPGGATLVFDVELFSTKEGSKDEGGPASLKDAMKKIKAADKKK